MQNKEIALHVLKLLQHLARQCNRRGHSRCQDYSMACHNRSSLVSRFCIKLGLKQYQISREYAVTIELDCAEAAGSQVNGQ